MWRPRDVRERVARVQRPDHRERGAIGERARAVQLAEQGERRNRPEREAALDALDRQLVSARLLLVRDRVHRGAHPTNPACRARDGCREPCIRRIVPDHLSDAAPRTDVVGGQASGREYTAPLASRVTLGRGAGCDIRLDDDAVAEVQCEFMWLDDAVYVRDLAAESPTLVGGAQLRVPRPIEDRDTLRVGHTELRLIIEPARSAVV